MGAQGIIEHWKQRVKVNKKLSEQHEIKYGVLKQQSLDLYYFCSILMAFYNISNIDGNIISSADYMVLIFNADTWADVEIKET